MTIGVPASLKSTWARNYALQNEYAWLSSDNIRRDYDYDISNNDVFLIMYNRTKDCLKKGISVIYDATNLSMKRRKNLLDNLKASHFDDVVFYRCEVFAAPVEILKERNANRTGADCVPEYVIDRMITQFQFPQYFEGWDWIHVNERSVGGHLDLKQMEGFDQHNPHHQLNLFDHSYAVADLICESIGDLSYEVGIWHDVGKLYTQTFDEHGIAHYLNHANVSAYIYLLDYINTYSSITTNFFDNIFVINYHMRPMNWTPKSYKKDKALFGEHYTHLLKLFHQCDVKGGKAQ